MANYINDCSCNYIGGKICGLSQCTTCGCTYDPVVDGSGNLIGWKGTGCSPANLINITQKRIWNTVRVPASEYTMNLASLSVYQEPSNHPKYSKVNWNQMSDRALPANLNVSKPITTVPSHGNSTRYSITRERPGSQRPGGKGVDIKHGSYARYLARLKGKGPLRGQKDTTLTTSVRQSPGGQQIALQNKVIGNKTKKFGIVGSSLCYC
jgi:hypothetical protein